MSIKWISRLEFHSDGEKNDAEIKLSANSFLLDLMILHRYKKLHISKAAIILSKFGVSFNIEYDVTFTKQCGMLSMELKDCVSKNGEIWFGY